MSSHPQIPEDVAALITAHALGALEPDQAALAERHIAASDACRRAYEDALETAALLAMAVADSEPPAELRDRSLDVYRRASAYAESRGIILADTKFEFGYDDVRPGGTTTGFRWGRSTLTTAPSASQPGAVNAASSSVTSSSAVR